MRRILLVLAVVLAAATARAAETNLLTGVDLVAWKLARTQVRQSAFVQETYAEWTAPEDAKPLASTMKKTATGDYEFEFTLTGAKTWMSPNPRDHAVYDLSKRRCLVKSKVNVLGRGMLQPDGVVFVRELK